MVFRILSSLLTMSNKSLSSSLSKYSSMLTNSLGNNASKRIDDYYVPLYVKLKSQLDLYNDSQISNNDNKKPFMVGISAPQGCGKTTTVTLLRDLFESDNYRCIVMSLDDFYLTFDEQQELANKFNNNPLLKYRGNAGSHDINLTLKTLNEFNNTSCEEIMIPSYNKMLNNGRGDRNPVEKWEKVLNPNNVDVVLFEGWMLGFQSINPDILSSMKTDIKPPLFPKAIDMNGITQVNDILKDYKALHEIFDQWLVLALDDVNHVYRWRLEQEQASADDNSGLSSDGVKDFVNRFMPAYRAYLENLYDDKIGPERKNGVDVMKIIVGGDRLPSHKIE